MISREDKIEKERDNETAKKAFSDALSFGNIKPDETPLIYKVIGV